MHACPLNMCWQPPDEPDENQDQPRRQHGTSISPVLACNGFIWLCIVTFFSFSQNHEAITSADTSDRSDRSDRFKILASVVSMIHVALETQKRYPLNGKWILLNIFALSTFFWSYIAISGLCSANFTWLKMFILVQGTILLSRFILDASRKLGANIA